MQFENENIPSCCSKDCYKTYNSYCRLVIMVSIMVVSLLAGGAVIQYLELPNEREAIMNANITSEMARGEIINYLVNKTCLSNWEKEEAANSKEILIQLAIMTNVPENNHIWREYFSAVFFLVTVVTTIGNYRYK